MSGTTLSFSDRVARVLGRVQRGQLVLGMLHTLHKSDVSEKRYAKDLEDAYTYKTKDPKTGKQVTRWLYPSSTLGRWTNSGAVALALGFVLDADDEGPSDLPAMLNVAPLYAILKTAKDLEDGDAKDAIVQSVRDAWTAANEAFAAGKTKTLLLAVEQEVARRTKRKQRTTATPNDPTDGNADDASVTVTFDPAQVIALRPILDAWIAKTATDLNVSRVKVRTIATDFVRFVTEHGPGNVGPALLLTDEEVQEDGEDA